MALHTLQYGCGMFGGRCCFFGRVIRVLRIRHQGAVCRDELVWHFALLGVRHFRLRGFFLCDLVVLNVICKKRALSVSFRVAKWKHLTLTFGVVGRGGQHRGG